MAAHPLRWSRLVVLGLVSGLAQVAAGVTTYLAGVYFAPWSMWVSIVVLAACIALGNAWYARHVLAGRTVRNLISLSVVGAVLSALIAVAFRKRRPRAAHERGVCGRAATRTAGRPADRRAARDGPQTGWRRRKRQRVRWWRQ